jgi:hypothetical protein
MPKRYLIVVLYGKLAKDSDAMAALGLLGKFSSAIVIVLACAIGQLRLDAQDAYFLPGDAFFHTQMTEEMVNELRNGKRRYLTYVRLSGGAFRGSAGYVNLEFDEAPEYLNEGLFRAYWWVRSCNKPRFIDNRVIAMDEATGKLSVAAAPELEEYPGISVFIYNSDFDFTSYEIGLKYNETWYEEMERFGFSPGHVQLDEFFLSPTAIALSWQMARRVDGLKVAVPAGDVPDRKASPEPIVVSGPVVALIPLCNDAQQSLDFDAVFEVIAVTPEGVVLYERDGHSWNSGEALPEVVITPAR